ncbi:MAG TPA: hypothetical protein VGZ27_00810 [Vicinamibacterales bacterium]|jgi:hypothetical protein|nr:hypothetical protein [Vicinamibacterales bacterium]
MKTRTGQLPLAMIAAISLAFLPAAAVAKQEKKVKTKGASAAHSMTGCLQKGSTPNTYELTNVEGNGPKTVEIMAMAAGVNLAPHVGHKVTITGTTIRAKAPTKAEAKEKAETAKESAEHRMKVNEVKMLSSSCS